MNRILYFGNGSGGSTLWIKVPEGVKKKLMEETMLEVSLDISLQKLL